MLRKSSKHSCKRDPKIHNPCTFVLLTTNRIKDKQKHENPRLRTWQYLSIPISQSHWHEQLIQLRLTTMPCMDQEWFVPDIRMIQDSSWTTVKSTIATLCINLLTVVVLRTLKQSLEPHVHYQSADKQPCSWRWQLQHRLLSSLYTHRRTSNCKIRLDPKFQLQSPKPAF